MSMSTSARELASNVGVGMGSGLGHRKGASASGVSMGMPSPIPEGKGMDWDRDAGEEGAEGGKKTRRGIGNASEVVEHRETEGDEKVKIDGGGSTRELEEVSTALHPFFSVRLETLTLTDVVHLFAFVFVARQGDVSQDGPDVGDDGQAHDQAWRIRGRGRGGSGQIGERLRVCVGRLRVLV